MLMILLFIPETYHPVLLRQKAVKVRRETGNNRWKAPIEWLERSIPQTIIRSIYRPFLLLTLEPMCLNLCIFSAVLLGILYLYVFQTLNRRFCTVFGVAKQPSWKPCTREHILQLKACPTVRKLTPRSLTDGLVHLNSYSRITIASSSGKLDSHTSE